MKQIHDESRGYRILLPLVNWMFRHSYRHIKYVGEENIPQDGAVIFAPNHTNALQDALAVLSINSERKVFVARADIFRKLAKNISACNKDFSLGIDRQHRQRILQRVGVVWSKDHCSILWYILLTYIFDVSIRMSEHPIHQWE